MHEGGVDLHEFCARTHAGTQMISGLDPADRKQSHVGPAEPAQVFDLLAGLSLPLGILPGPVALCCRWWPGVVGGEQAIEAQLDKQAGDREGRAFGHAAQLGQQRHASPAVLVQLALFFAEGGEQMAESCRLR